MMDLTLDTLWQIKILQRHEAALHVRACAASFGRAGDWRSQPSMVVLRSSLEFEQRIELGAVNLCERTGQRCVDTPVGTRDRFSANALYIVERWKQHLLPAIFVDERGREYDSFVSLPGHILEDSQRPRDSAAW